MKARLTDQKGALDFCVKEGELITISKEVDPLYEIAGISKSFDGGPTVLFENIKGYPKWKAVTNIFANRDRVARYFGTTKQGLPKRILDAARNPIQPKLVTQAPCQENVITKDIDILNFLPVITHTKLDIGPVISGGVVMISVPKELGGGDQSFNLSFHRINPSLGKDWVSMATLYSRHFLEVLYHHKSKKQEYPVTINIGMSPGCNVVASGGDFPQIRPIGTDDLGMAGNLGSTNLYRFSSKEYHVGGVSPGETEILSFGAAAMKEGPAERKIFKSPNLRDPSSLRPVQGRWLSGGAPGVHRR